VLQESIFLCVLLSQFNFYIGSDLSEIVGITVIDGSQPYCKISCMHVLY